MAINNTTLSTVNPTSVHTSTGNSALTVMYICNTNDTVSAQINVHVVPNTVSPSVNNLIYKEVVLAPKDTYVVDTEKMILSNGDSIYVSSSIAGSVVVTVSYVGI